MSIPGWMAPFSRKSECAGGTRITREKLIFGDGSGLISFVPMRNCNFEIKKSRSFK